MVVQRGYVIREAEPDDYGAIGEITVEAYRTAGETHEDYFRELRDVADRAGRCRCSSRSRRGAGGCSGA